MQAEVVSRELLGDVGTKLAHVQTAARVAGHLSVLFDPTEAELLVAAATLHDIGYSPRIARTGFHPLDGAVFLRAEGFNDRLAALVAHHSWAVLTAGLHGIDDLAEQFPPEHSLLADALVYADMHSAPDGRMIPAGQRLADIALRHPQEGSAERALMLRAAMARVGAALLEVQRSRVLLLPQPRGLLLAASAVNRLGIQGIAS
ncbi:MAG: HD domain-containing protein [Candidatus Nanopelagicales bacterium]